MRIPHIINENTMVAYETSLVTLNLLHEISRKLKAEDLHRINNQPEPLSTLCIRCISNHIQRDPVVMKKLILCADRDFLVENLSPSLPLTFVVPLIDDQVYWKRRYRVHNGELSYRLHYGWTWKCVYLENHIRDLIERAHPDQGDEELMEQTLNLVNPYIHRVVISQLQSWVPPPNMTEDEKPEHSPCDHVNLEPIFSRLPNLSELDLVFVEKNLGDTFSWRHFTISLDDARRLGKALLHLKKLRIFNLHSSCIGDQHIQILVPELIKVISLEQLTIDNCLIGDRGALCIAKLMMSHPKLQRLSLYNNRIGAIGGEGIGYALMQETCCPIKYLNLRMNPLTHRGLMGLFRAMIRVQKLEELIIAGCGFNDETSIRVASLLKVDRKLRSLDISNNWCAPGQYEILQSVMANSTILQVDLRECDISGKFLARINRKLNRNRGYEDVVPHDEEGGPEEEVYEDVQIDDDEYEYEGGDPEDDDKGSYLMDLFDLTSYSKISSSELN